MRITNPKRLTPYNTNNKTVFRYSPSPDDGYFFAVIGNKTVDEYKYITRRCCLYINCFAGLLQDFTLIKLFIHL